MLIKLATYLARVLEGCQSTRKIGRLPFLRKGLFVTNSTLAQALAASMTSGITQFTRSPTIYDGLLKEDTSAHMHFVKILSRHAGHAASCASRCN